MPKLTDEPLTEVVKMRISEKAKEAIQKEAKNKYRSFQQQVRVILDGWCE